MENWYPLVNIQKLWKITIYKKLWKITIEIVNFPMKNGGSFHSFSYVYQRVKLLPGRGKASPPGTTRLAAHMPARIWTMELGTWMAWMDWKFGWTCMDDYGWKSTWKWVLVSLDESRFESGCFSPEARESGWITMDFFDIHLSYSMLDGSQSYIQINVCNWMYRA